jgi:predicted aldo/keto reductase-like oxidoreductase
MSSKSSMNRRRFLQTGTAGLAGLSLVPGTAFSRVQTEKKKAGKIITRRLGRTGLEVPVVSMGVMNADNPAVMKAAYEAGIRHFDTAWRYQNGRNEQMVGQVIREMGIRDKIVLATKVPLAFGNHSSYTTEEMAEQRKIHGKDLERKLKEDYIKTFEESLQRLQQDYVDILYVHSVKDPATVELPFLQEALAQLKKQGKVRFLGVSSHRRILPVFNRVIELDFYDLILSPFNFKITGIEQVEEVLQRARRKGLGVVAMKTQALYGPGRQTHHTAALKYVLQHEFIDTAIPGFTTFDQLEEDFSVARDLGYTPEEKQFFDDYLAGKREQDVARADLPCQGCETCLNTCPRGVDIPDLMRTYMYAAGYANFEQARITYQTLGDSQNLNRCRDCRTCTAACQNGLDIRGNLQRLASLFG